MMALSYGYARRYNHPVEEVFQWSRVKSTFKDAAWAFLLPVIILGGIFGGIVTATEGAALAVLAALFIGGMIYRELDLRHLHDAMVEGAIQAAIVMLLVAASALLGVCLTGRRCRSNSRSGCPASPTNRYAVLGILNVFFLMIGLFLHAAEAIILVVPIVMPLVNAVGIDPVHFGLVVTLEPRHRPADAAGGERADGVVFDREGRHVENDARESSVHRRAGGDVAAGYLCAGGADGVGGVVLSMIEAP